jgi:hypothetical protein
MKVSADQVRAATRVAAAVITADKVPPFRLHESAGSRGLAHRTRFAWTRLAWVGPLAAAAAVVIVVVGSVAVGSSFARSGKGRSGNSGASKPGVSAGSYAGVPPYYVAMGNPSLAIVRATATGATLVRITTNTPFVGVAGAANDRTFVLDAQRQIIGPSVTWPGQPQFSLLRLTASGTEESYSRLALAPLPKGSAVTGLALTPDGSKLAVAIELGKWRTARGVMEIRVYTLATGAYRTWSAPGSADSEDPAGFTGSGTDGSESISWGADSRTLAFDWMNGSLRGVRLLDTAASGDNLIADSRLAVIEINFSSHSGPPTFPFPSKDDVSPCVTDSIMSLDGSAVVCGYSTNMDGQETTTGFIRYSTRTGKPVALIGVYQFQGQGAGGDNTLLWVNSTGTMAIGGIGTPSGIQTGVINGGKFTPLPAITDLNTAAW